MKRNLKPKLDRFALEVVSDAVLIVEKTANTFDVAYANAAFERMCGVSRQQLKIGEKMFLLDEIRFLQTAEEALVTNEVQAPRFAFQLRKNRSQSRLDRLATHNDTQYVNTFVTFYPYLEDQGKDPQYCCCLFKKYPYEDEELLRYYKVVDRYIPCIMSVLEYDEEKDDVVQVYHCSFTATSYKLEGTDIQGQYYLRDFAVSQEEMHPYLTAYRKFAKRCKTENEENLIDELVLQVQSTVTVNSVERMLDTEVYFLGTNQATGRQQFIARSLDVTKLSQFQQQLVQKEQSLKEVEEKCDLFRKFFDSCPVFMGLLDVPDPDDWTKTTIIRCNPATAALYGSKSTQNIKAVDFCRGCPPSEEVQRIWSKAYKEAARTGRSAEFETGVPDSNGITTYVYAFVKHVSDNLFIYLSQNITTRKQLEIQLQKHKDELEETVKNRTKQLEDALEVKSRFLATMSHEIRTPLSGIIGMLNLLSEVITDTGHQEMIRIASVCGEQLMIVINDILDLCRLENNKMPLEIVSLSLYKTVEEALEVVAFESEKKGLELIYNMDPLLPDIIKGDASRIRQVLINLLGNAVKFSSSGDIVISTSGTQKDSTSWNILFSVQDHGIGISEAAKAKLFSPFQQADNSYTRKFGGSGLGLVISKKMVELMGGSMWFESTEGEGSTFYFNLPVTTVGSAKKERVQLLAGKRVLVVESNCTLLKVIVQYLHSIGMIVTKSQGGATALQLFKQSTYDVAIIGKQHTYLVPDLSESTSCVVLCSSYIESSRYNGVHYLPLPLRYTKLFDCLVNIFSPTQNKNQSSMLANNDLSEIQILIAEDNTLNQKVIRKVLDSIACKHVEIVGDGKQALDAVKSKHFDVVLMDCMMPVMNGYEATERIRSEIPLQDQPAIVALTANAFEENKKQCFLAGMDFVLTKPLQKKELIATLDRIAHKESLPN